MTSANRSVLAFAAFLITSDAIWWFVFDAFYWIDLIGLTFLFLPWPIHCRSRGEYYTRAGTLFMFALALWFVLEMNLYLYEYGPGNIPAVDVPSAASIVFITVKLGWCLINVALCLRAGRNTRRFTKGFCPSCSYDLTANASGACPECGASVDTERSAGQVDSQSDGNPR